MRNLRFWKPNGTWQREINEHTETELQNQSKCSGMNLFFKGETPNIVLNGKPWKANFWTVVSGPIQDGDGWQYGTNWSSKHWRASPMMVLDVVRRRKWTIKYTLNFVGQALVLTIIIVSLGSDIGPIMWNMFVLFSLFVFTSNFNKVSILIVVEIFSQNLHDSTNESINLQQSVNLWYWKKRCYPPWNLQFAPENRPKPNREGSYSNHPFLGAFDSVSFRERVLHQNNG